MNRKSILILSSLLLSLSLSAQHDTTSTVNKKRLNSFVIGTSVAYTATMIGLSELWYSESSRQSFQFFNDSREWKQVDKAGHFLAAFYFSNSTYRALRWSGVNEKKSMWIGALAGFGVLLPIEVFDGFSEAYGASASDLGANALGAGFFLLQTSYWHEVRIHPKFSYHHTRFAALRPELLGDTYTSRIIKDYNGQTYWLSVDVDKFISFPKWLNVAVGYGANSMISADDNSNTTAGYDAYRQYYLGIDIDLTGIQTRSRFLKGLFAVVSAIKLPAPAIEFSRKGTKVEAFSF